MILKNINFWKKSIFARLFMTFLVVMIPIYFIGIRIYNWGIDTVKAETMNSRASQISVYMGNLESDIQRIKILQSDCLYSDELNRLANSQEYMDDYEKGTYILRLQQRLNAIKSSSFYIKDAIAMIPSIGKSIPAWGSIDDIEEEDLQTLKAYDDSTHSQLIFLKNELFMNAGFPLNYSSGTLTPLYTIQIRLSSEDLQKPLKQFDYYMESGTILFNAQKQFMITTGKDLDLSNQIKAYAENQRKIGKEGKGWLDTGNRRYLVIFKTSPYLGLTLCNYTPEDEMFKSLKEYQLLFWLFSIAAAFIVAVFSISMYKIIQQPLKKLIKAFKRLESGDMNFIIKHKYNDEFEYLYEHFNGMLQNLNTLIDQSYKQKIMVQRAELKQLQAQINPHFLYNSFFILYTMTRRGEYDTLEQFALQLGDYFQFVTRSAADEVPLSREVSHARTYCDIQGMRFSNRIRIEFDELPARYTDIRVPRLIIQPIVENAFEYGLEMKEENGLLKIMFVEEGQKLCILIEDNGEGINDEEIEKLQRSIAAEGNEIETTGTVNIHRRIQLKFGHDSGVFVSRGELGGLKVSIYITLPKEEEHVQAVDC